MDQQHIIDRLENLVKEHEWIELSLHPGIGDSTIRPCGNRLFINSGRAGKFDDISESFYDELVSNYDSRLAYWRD